MFKLLGVAVILALAAACSSDDGPAPDASPSPDVPVGTTAEEPPAASDLHREIAATLESFFQAFLNDDPVKLTTYWAEGCAQEDIDLINENLVFFANASGGEVELSIDAGALIIEELGDGRVRIPASAGLASGTFELLVDGWPFSDLDPEEEGEDVVLVLEEGAWRVTGCDQFAANLQLGD